MTLDRHIGSLLSKSESYSDISRIRDFLKTYLEEKRGEVREVHLLCGGGREVASLQAELMDSIIISLFRTLSTVHGSRLTVNDSTELAILALGGYGRSELSPYSDIDIMFLYPQKLSTYSRATSENILYILWDLGLDIGHSVRSFKDCIDMAQQDIKVKTSLLESRFLCGKREVYDLFRKKVLEKILSHGGSSFIREKLEETHKRHIHYGGSPYLLEPHIKEGEGGLRDIQTALWIAKVKLKTDPESGSWLEEIKRKGIITDKEYLLLQRSYDFLQRVRNELHYLSDRRNDVLSFEFQETVARFFGHKDSANFTAAERFMRRYYLYTKGISDTSLAIIRRSLKRTRQFPGTIKKIGDSFILSGREIGLAMNQKDIRTNRNPFVERPKMLMEVFQLCQRHNATISVRTKDLIREGLHLINNDFRSSCEIKEVFLSLLNTKANIYETLKTMHEIGILGKYLPEFGRLRVLVLYDLYHKYTVDEHTLLAIKNLTELKDTKYKKLEKLSDIFNSLRTHRIPFLALLLHDTGKASGKGHVRAVEEIIEPALKRLGLTGDEGDRISFLVKNHLVMSMLSERRELSDPKVIESFASEIVNEENLNMLYLISYADISAVRPGFWTDWKAALLEELYTRTLYLLRGKPFMEDENEKLSQIEEALKVSPDISRNRLEAHLKNFTRRYLIVTPATIIINHILLTEKIREEKPIITYIPDYNRGITEFTILSYDEPGIFSRITGAIASRGINIVGGQIFTGKDGMIIDRIQISNPDQDPTGLEETLRRLQVDIRSVLTGERKVEDLIFERPAYLKIPQVYSIPEKVVINNEASEDYSIIEVFCRDKIGLLYQITKTLYETGIDISSAKINTEVERVADVFYVTDGRRGKILDKKRIDDIKEALHSVISG